MKKKIIIAVAAIAIVALCIFWFVLPVSKGRELYKSYLQDKFGCEPTIVTEDYHFYFDIRNHGYMGVTWNVDAGSYGSYQFTTIGSIMAIDGETYTMKKR